MIASLRPWLCRTLVFLSAVLVCDVVPMMADSVRVSVSPPSLGVKAGQTLSLDISISGVTDLYAFQFDLGFDPAILAVTAVSEGSFLPSGGPTLFIPGTIDNVGGTISFNADTLLGPIPGVTGSGTLAIVDFSAIGSGTSALNLFNIDLLDSNLNGISFTSSNGSVTVSSVPEPPALLLLTSGLLVLSGACSLRRWLRRSSYSC